MSNPYQVLVLDDKTSICRLLEKELSSEQRHITSANSAAEARDLISQNMFDVMVLDIKLPDGDGMELLSEFKDRMPDVEIIMITGHGNIDSAVEAIKIGAYDYLTKPFSLDKLEFIVEKAYQRVCLQRQNRGLKQNQNRISLNKRLVGNSAPMKEIQRMINKVAPADVPILITGESGAGKDVVARAIHSQSRRAEMPIIVKNCATLQKELARSELFGHRKGSFTGALDNQEGLLTFAHKGTLFLDEIGELPIEVQASLLRVLENKTYRRVGEKEERIVDTRLLLATNRNLAKEVEEGRFHEALFHRVNVINIHIPMLKDRKEDIPLLTDHFLHMLADGGPVCRFTERAMQRMLNYDWPGNVRELRNVIERSIILSEQGLITEDILPREMLQDIGQEESSNLMSLEAMEKKHIRNVISFFTDNRSKAAKALGISRKTLYRKMEKYDLGA